MWPDGVDLSQAPGRLVPTTVGVRVRGSSPPRDAPLPTKAFVPRPLPATADIGALLAGVHPEYTAAVQAVAALDAKLGSFDDPQLLIAPLMQREAILSSRIENTIASAEEVALYESERQSSNDDAIEVWNYLQAMTYGLASALPISKRLICEMHGVLMSGVRGGDRSPGSIRQHQNWIGGDEHDFATCRFVPPPAAAVDPEFTAERCIDHFERYVNAEDLGFPELIAIGMAHYQFEAIHPFGDGNGRLGRLLISLMLCRRAHVRRPAVYVSGYFERRRPEYNDHLLRVSTQGAWIPWIRFFLDAVATEAADSGRRIERLRTLQREVLERVTRPRTSMAVKRLVDWLIERPVVTIPQAAAFLGMTPQAAATHINRLESVGFLSERSGRSYGRVWVAQEVLRIIEDRSEDP